MTRERLLLTRNGWVPNNPRLPVAIYRGAVSEDGMERTAAAFERLFQANGWPPRWRFRSPIRSRAQAERPTIWGRIPSGPSAG